MRGRSVGAGFAWASAGRLTLQASNLVALTVTSRFITPEQFGLFAPVVILASFIYAASEGAFATALMQRVELTDDHVRVSFWASTTTAVVMMMALIASAPLIERGFGFHGLAPVIAAASLLLPARLISAVPTALLQRQMRFRELASVTLFAAIVGKIIPTVVLAVRGFGEWALVVGFVAQTYLEVAILLYLARPAVGWPSDWHCARDILSFGGRFTIIQSVNQVAQNVDNIIVGRLLGPAALGFYSRVFALMMLPVNLIGSSAQQVLFPRFSRLQEDRPALRSEMHLALDLVSGLILPLSALLAIVADSFVLLVLGPNWSPIIMPTRILFAMVSFRIGYKVTETVAFATASLTPALIRQAGYAGLIAVGALVGSRWGLTGVAVGVGTALLIFYAASLHAALRLVDGGWHTIASLYARGSLVTILAAGPAAMIGAYAGQSLQARVAADAGACLVFVAIMALIVFKGPRWLAGASRDVLNRMTARRTPIVQAPVAPTPAEI
jgi:O-antigen/teichoic acid export membrane protein